MPEVDGEIRLPYRREVRRALFDIPAGTSVTDLCRALTQMSASAACMAITLATLTSRHLPALSRH
jgi:hypothetical protein